MIIGLTGTLGAGKGTLADFLDDEGFKHYSVTNFLTQEIEKRKETVNCDSMVRVANELRQEHGPDYIVKRLYKRAKRGKKNALIESIRTKGEVDTLKSLDDFCLIAVDADPKLRYDRIMKRKSEKDQVSLEKFLSDEKREMFSTDPAKQSLSSCINASDYIFINNFNDGTPEENIAKARYEFVEGKIGFVNLIKGERRRPGFDEKYMNEAFDWASRSTCLRRAVGAVIVKGDRVVSQGYNGAVRNSRHCKELGCRREQLNVPSGERLESCRGVHAEENAIINAGRHGINVIGATLYCTTKPCSLCTKTIIQSGITRVVYDSGYGDELSEEMFNEVGINVERYSGVSPFSFKRFWGRKDKGFLEPIK